MGKCSTCRKPTAEHKVFLVTIDMFDPSPKNLIKGELLDQVKEWRQSKMYCEKHKTETVVVDDTAS